MCVTVADHNRGKIMIVLRAIDPSDCGCNECLTGESVPMNRATQQQLIQALTGRLVLQTDEPIDIEITMTIEREDLEHPTLPTHGRTVTELLRAALAIQADITVTPA